jgi:hypothetical protein
VLVEGGKAAEQRGNEEDPARAVYRFVVDVEIAGGVDGLGHIQPAATLVDLAGTQ